MYKVIILTFFTLINIAYAKENYYKVKKEKDFLSCLTPYTIEGLNVKFIKNEENESIYKIELLKNQGNCNWQRDKLYFKNSIAAQEAEKINSKYPTQIYLDTSFDTYFKITKLQDYKKFLGKTIILPYFIVLSDDDNIIWQENELLKINLTSKKETIVKGKTINIKHKFNSSDYVKLEILTGIYNEHK